MKPLNAFDFLGLERDAEPDQVRRAYLRLLKKFHPERDPDGFQTLRAAYEVARDVASSDDDAAEYGRHGTSWTLEEAPDVASGETLEPVAPERFALQPFLAKLEAIPDDADDPWAARAEIARQAVDALPENAQAVILLASVLRNASKFDESLAVLRAGSARGLDRCKRSIFLHHSDALTEEEQAWPLESSFEEVSQVTVHLLESDQSARATPLVEVLLERADEAYEATVAEALIQICLLLQIDGQVDLAQRLLPEIDRRLDVKSWGNESDEIAIVWRLTQELTEIADSFPLQLRQAIATGIYYGRLTEVTDVMHDYAMAYPSLTYDASRHLMKAPTLDHLYRHLLSGPQSADYGGHVKAGMSISAVVWLLFILMRCAGASDDPASYYTPPDSREPLIYFEDPVRSICTSPSSRVEEACEMLRLGVAEVGLDRCFEALGTLAILEAIPNISPEVHKSLANTLRGMWSRNCETSALASDWPSYRASPSVLALCSSIDVRLNSEQLYLCFLSRSTFSALGASECSRAQESLAELKRLATATHDEIILTGFEEVWTQVFEACEENP